MDFERFKKESETFGKDVVAAVFDPKRFYAYRYSRISEEKILIAAGALALIQGLIMAVKFGQVATVMSTPIYTGIGIAIWAGVVSLIGSYVFERKNAYKDVAVLFAFLCTATIPLSVIGLLLFSPFSVLPTLLGTCAAFYMFHGGAKYRLGFSNKQILCLLVVPAIFTMVGLMAMATVGTVAEQTVQNEEIMRELLRQLAAESQK